ARVNNCNKSEKAHLSQKKCLDRDRLARNPARLNHGACPHANAKTNTNTLNRRKTMNSQRRYSSFLALAAGAWISIFQAAHAAEEVVVPFDNPEPPTPISVPEGGDPGDIILGATQGCYGQNNRSTANSARATDTSSISQIYSFELSNGQKVYRKVTRAGSSIGPQISPSFSCTKVVANGFCTTEAACQNSVGSNIKYSCEGIQHESLSKEHSCNIGQFQNTMTVSCSPHTDTAKNTVAKHLGCRLKKRATRISSAKYSPGQIECRHYAPKDYASNTTVQASNDGVNWVRDNSATVEISKSERFQVRLRGIAAGGVTIRPASVKMAYVQSVPSNAGNCGFGGCNGALTHRERGVTALNKAVMVNVAFAGSD
ncbi:hypothetical protein EBZ37_14395, partial [bacterium]|nr:hypothetical protein [bacterium]